MRSPDLLDRIAPDFPLFGLAPKGAEEDSAPSLALDPRHSSPDDEPGPFLATTPLTGDFSERAQLDPARAVDEPEKPAQSVRRRTLPFGLIGSIGLHLLPLLLLLVTWPIAPAQVAPPIPVQLVVEQPKPAPAPLPPPPPEKKPPPGRLASEDLGNPASKQRQPGAEPEPTAPQPAPTQMVSALPPPKPSATPLPEATDQPQQQAMLPPPPKPAALQPRRREPTPRLPAHLGFPGTAASRNEYLAYCNEMIRRHFDLLPLSFIGDRRGLTVLSLLVLDDGRIARISVVRSSGYHDIDERVERMVAAVGRFPPLPQWFQGQEMPLEYELPIPNGLIRR